MYLIYKKNKKINNIYKFRGKIKMNKKKVSALLIAGILSIGAIGGTLA